MPDNTWFNPYKLSFLKCLSSGPSQGIVYGLNDVAVIKVPFQYPVGEGSTIDDKIDHLVLSLKSFNFFKQECRFYELLARHSHPNVVIRFQCNRPDCIVLEKVKPLQEAWINSTGNLRDMWILELLDVLSFVEDLGYLHGDISIFNMGIDYNNRLKIFDFGSAVHHKDEDFEDQILEDQFNLATCIHFLASGIDPFAQAKSASDINRIRQDLQQGKFPVIAAAKRFQGLMEACWSRKQSYCFKDLRKAITHIVGIQRIQTASRLGLSQVANLSLDSLLKQVIREEGWMNEEEYCTAWSKEGFKIPPLI